MENSFVRRPSKAVNRQLRVISTALEGRRTYLTLALAIVLLTCASSRAAPRTWMDATGKFSVSAELVEHNAERVVLKKSDGAQITVPLNRLSAADRRYLNDLADDTPPPVALGEAKTYRVRTGVEITTAGAASGVVAVIAVPMQWPEQSVRVVDQEKTAGVGRITFRDLNGGARQMMISVPRLRQGETARATVTYEVTRHALVGPAETGDFRIPRRLDRDLRHYLKSGPLTDVKDPKIVAAKDKAVAGVDGAWNQVRAIHDWVIDNVRYQERPQIKSASIALEEKVGDCQELSSLFVAMCRAHGVPARCVWVPRHSYAEFYLEDAQGRGCWFPAESTNKEQFGFLPRTDVILQKGDNFQVPGIREPLHYAQTTMTAKDVQGAQPELKEIREIEVVDAQQ